MKSAFTFMKFSIKNKMKAGWYKLLSYVSFGKLKRRFTKKFYKFKELSIQPHIEIVQKQHEDKVIIKIVQKFIYNLEDDIKNIQQDCRTHDLNSHCHDNLEKIQQKITEFNVLLQEKKYLRHLCFFLCQAIKAIKKLHYPSFLQVKKKFALCVMLLP